MHYVRVTETGIGTLKTHAHYASARHDRPGEWTCDDVEEARLLGNAFSHPHGHRGGTPDEAWEQHRRFTVGARRRLREVYDEEVEKEKEHRGVLPLVGPTPQEQDTIDRYAISAALRRCGYLEFRRRRITPPVHPRKAARVS